MRITPGDDPWMVRVSLSSSLDGGAPAGASEVERYTAVDLDPDDTTPGVYPWSFEHARLSPRGDGSWRADRDRVEARNDGDAFGDAAAAYDAARGFLLLGIAPTGGPTAVQAPGLLTLEIGDDAWTFPRDDAPAAAWAVLRAMRLER